MKTNTNNIDENEPIVDETDDIEETELGAADASGERSHGRGRRGRRGRRPFGPNRPYRFALFVEEDGSYVLRSPDLADRTATIASLDELGATMQSAIDERAAEDAAAAAEAEKDEQFSGKFVLRLPRSMHRQLTELAETEGVSLNQLALGFLAEGLGRAETIHEFGGRRGKHRGPRGGHGPGGRGPWGRGPRGDRERDPERDSRSSRDRHDFDLGRHDQRGHGFRRSRWFMGEAPGPVVAPDGPNANDESFI